MSDTTHHVQRHRRRGSHRHGPVFTSIWFMLLGFNWFALVIVGLIFLRPHPLVATDYFVSSIGFGLGLFYFFVAYAVFTRRKYIVNVAFACAGLGLAGIPIGTIISLMLLASLSTSKHNFTR